MFVISICRVHLFVSYNLIGFIILHFPPHYYIIRFWLNIRIGRRLAFAQPKSMGGPDSSLKIDLGEYIVKARSTMPFIGW